MKQTKQWMAVLLSAVLLMGTLPAAALAEEPGDPQLGETGSVQQEELNALPRQAETDPPAQQEEVNTLPKQAEADPPAQQEEVNALPQQAEADPPAQQEEVNALPQQEGTGNPAGDVTADPTHVTVATSDEFRAALKNDDVTHITFSGRLVVESVRGDNELYAGTKVITPEHRDSDEDNLIFAEGVTMLHISEHEGNQQNEATQSIRLIYGREYEQGAADFNLLAEAAEGWVGWYEYHAENDPNASGDDDDPHAGHRVCYVLYCGRWQDAVTAAEDLTANGWNHPAVKEGDDNQLVFFQFGKRRSSGRDITISRDIEVTGWTEVSYGQNLVVQSGATLTTAALTLETMGKRSGWGYVDANTSNLTVRNGGTVNIHRPDTSYVGEDNVHLGAEGRIAVENLATGLVYDENADIWCEYHPFLFSARPVETDGVPPKGQAGDWNSLSGTLSMTQGSTLDGWLCGVTFDRRDSACGWYCDPEGWETAKVTDTSGREAAGLTIADAGDGKVRLTAVTAGTYRVYLYHNPEDFADEWGDWVPTGFGTGIPGTEGVPLTVTVTASGGNRPDSGRDDRDDDDGTHQVSLPSRVVGGEVSVRPRNAKEGDRVTVTAAPRDGYELASVTVTDARGRTVPTTDMGNGQYAFTMPDSRIKVTTSFVPIAAQPAAKSFTDVAPGAYYYDAVQWAVSKGITGGTSGDRFSPDTPCSRAQTVTFLWRAAGSPAPAGRENPFRDVQPGAYYYEAVLWAVEKGITGGTTAETFSPEATVTRGQTAAFLHRAAGSPAAGGSSFTDVPSGAYYAQAVQWAVERGITGGTGGGMFSPVTNCTRAQIVTFLYRGQ